MSPREAFEGAARFSEFLQPIMTPSGGNRFSVQGSAFRAGFMVQGSTFAPMNPTLNRSSPPPFFFFFFFFFFFAP